MSQALYAAVKQQLEAEQVALLADGATILRRFPHTLLQKTLDVLGAMDPSERAMVLNAARKNAVNRILNQEVGSITADEAAVNQRLDKATMQILNLKYFDAHTFRGYRTIINNCAKHNEPVPAYITPEIKKRRRRLQAHHRAQHSPGDEIFRSRI